ncbi:MAG: tRNA (guanosine(46)-N7)-methyltransferase TrmB [Firmicutes bacterium]|nr:tRNA (guanosine(46)-N7)-methyltransferase TrmB [Bacillota bacterium]
MRLRNVKNAKEILESSSYYIKNPHEKVNKLSTIFQNSNPINLEIGCGKGQFIINMAKKYPNINFIGLEKYESVLVRAIQKVNEEELPNLKFMCMDAKNLTEVFNHEIDTLYLNFSDPWPKNRHSDRRLTSHIFLKVYDNIFKGENKIIQKTDNIILFASSIESLSTYGYTINRVSLDLHNTDIENIKTEYEEKFSELGFKINYLEAFKK